MLRNLLILLLLLITVVEVISGHDQDDTNNVMNASSSSLASPRKNNEQLPVEQNRRQTLSFWNLLFLVNSNDHCPPGPLGKHCRDNTSSGGGGSSSSYSSGGSSATSYSTNGEYYENNNYEAAAEDSAGTNNQQTDNKGGAGMDASRSFKWLMFVAAGVAVAFAVGAVIMGQRPQPKEVHPLTGSVAKRMGVFGQWADTALCDSACNNVGQPRNLEMTMSRGDYVSDGGAVV